jgi:hypothetical protein
MGGPGSGRWSRGDTKPTVEHYRSLDVREWQRQGLLCPELRFIVSWRNQAGETTASVGVTVVLGAVELSVMALASPCNIVSLCVDPMPLWWPTALVSLPHHDL